MTKQEQENRLGLETAMPILKGIYKGIKD